MQSRAVEYGCGTYIKLLLVFPSWCLAAACWLNSPVSAQEVGEEGESAPAPQTFDVKREDFRIDVELEGVIESRNMVEIEAATESWTDLKVKQVVPQGAEVKEGDPVIWFETDELDKSIEGSRYDLELMEYALRTQELQLDQAEKLLEIDQQLAERKLQHALEDFDYYNAVERPLAEKTAENSLKSSQWSLENALEELEQLEKMYKEDELVEESEGIVLKRAQRNVEQSEFWLERSQQSTRRTLETELPREAENKQFQLERAKLEHDKQMVTLPMQVEKSKIELEKSRFDFEKKQQALQELLDDRELMELHAPADGIVYHGKAVRGKWSKTGSGSSREIQPGDKSPANKTLMTLVDPADIFIRCDLPEDKLGLLEVGMSGTATLVAYPEKKAVVTVAEVAMIPFADGEFDCQFSIDQEAYLMPGLSCTVKLTPYHNREAIVVPKSAVFSDDGGNTHYVFVWDGEQSNRQSVEVGRTLGDKTEIKSGLDAGQKILQEKPDLD